jgi:plastocyanin
MELNAVLSARLDRRQPESARPAKSLRRRLVAFAAVFLAAVAIACSGSDSDDEDASPTPGSTLTGATATQPAAEATTAATAAAPTSQPAATATAQPEPTAPPPTPTTAPQPTQPAPTATVAAGPQSMTINISAANIAFDRASISVPANTQVTVIFNNTDTGVPHDFGVTVPGAARTDICNGPCTDSTTFTSGDAATYQFNCSVHPQMQGTFTVQ